MFGPARDRDSARDKAASWPCSISSPNEGQRQAGWLVSLTTLSVLLNLIVVVVLFMNHAGPSAPPATAQQLHATTGLAAVVPNESAELLKWKTAHSDQREKFETLKERFTELQTSHADLREQLKVVQKQLVEASATPATPAAPAGCSESELAKMRRLEESFESSKKEASDLQKQLSEAKAAAASAASSTTCSTVAPTCPPCPASNVDHSRLLDSDLSLHPFDLTKHETTWTCPASIPSPEGKPMPYCSEAATNEQLFQLSFFDRPGAGSRSYAVKNPKPQSPKCVQLPPAGYKFPAKVQSMPLAEGEQAVHWPNLRVQKLEDLLVFNRGTPKNLYHFNASFYDYEQEGILNHAAKYIPWGHKVRTMLDVGSGGASLGMLAKRRYDVQVVSTVFADWPYCEYISERGQICMYIDAMEAMPFAKFSYDVVHSSWVFHALFNHQLRAAYLEQNRILRPGGYMWIYGGWSLEQVATMEQLLINELGYTPLLSQKNLVDRTKVKHSFDDIPFELEWTAILLKPIHADENSCHRVYEEKKL